jgi:hypothetical protein
MKTKEFMFEYFNNEHAYTSLLHAKGGKSLLCGTSKGSICVHQWPPVFTEKDIKHYRMSQLFIVLDYWEMQPQLFPITHMMMTPSEKNIISISSDGLVFNLKLDYKEAQEVVENKTQVDEKGGIAQTINELFLIKNSYLIAQNRAIRNKELEVWRNQKRMLTDEENKHKENKNKIARIEKIFQQSMQNSRELRNSFFASSEQKLTEKANEIKAIKDKLLKKAEELEAETNEIVEYEKVRNEEIRQEFEILKLEKDSLISKTSEEQKDIQRQYDGLTQADDKVHREPERPEAKIQ